ncbi:uncharacterized protein LOC129093448 isoform X2 [Anoplopoma fimbria]|uniref:uncharacterized protein LOC129093448 isoform X2 n=1 Tax=Anoplopoma fimbria TaxID=229290 RepID=UPI0023EC22A3|nr:uncharacterized protein LOC129093448 isoform X2 [Anoplopoma fimbria]
MDGDGDRVAFCPFCGKHISQLSRFCFSCGRSLEFLTEGPNKPATSAQPDNAKQTGKPCPSFKQFVDYRSAKTKEREGFNYGSRGKHSYKKTTERKPVQINIGLMVWIGTEVKPLRGKMLPVFVDPEIAAPELLKQAVQKMTKFNKDVQDGKYILLYPDRSEVVHLPGSERPFKLAEYKKELGRPYGRITLFICLETDFKGVADDTSESDSEIDIPSRSTVEFNRADTVVFEPQNQSTPRPKPRDERDEPGPSGMVPTVVISDAEDMDPTQSDKTCYRKYTDLYSPGVEEDEELVAVVSVENFQDTAVEEIGTTLPLIIANLSLLIDHKKVSRFNISRSNIWDGAVRGFKRSTYSEACDMLVRFTDDAGVFEEGIDTGGPRREFLTLLMKLLKDRPIFDGPEGHKFLVFNAND